MCLRRFTTCVLSAHRRDPYPRSVCIVNFYFNEFLKVPALNGRPYCASSVNAIQIEIAARQQSQSASSSA